MDAMPQNLGAEASAELWALASRSCNDALRSEDLARLESLLAEDPRARQFYGFYMLMHAELAWQYRAGGINDEERETRGGEFRDLEIWRFGDLPQGAEAAVEPPRQPEAGTPPSSFPLPPFTLSPISSSFVGGPVFSYMVATLVLGVMLLSAWAYTITHDHVNHIVENSRGLTAPGDLAHNPPDPVFVGRVTGMKDCRWADPAAAPFVGSHVPLKRKYVLTVGLLEITYKTGAKVILEGPCAFEVESDAGGYLSLGKLTARVDVAKPQAVNRSSPRDRSRGAFLSFIPHPSSFILHPSSLFTVRTPTAVVTDLGTEFGVEVGEEGNTTSHVFRGAVRVETRVGTGLAGGTQRDAMVLRENESVRVERVGRVRETHQMPAAIESVRFTHPTTPPKFVRAIPQQRRGFIDLADIVAGGDGFGWAKQRGIEAGTGRIVREPHRNYSLQGDYAYHRVDKLPLVDGVFVPDGGQGPVQLDSAGHRTSVLTDTDNYSWNYIWSGQIPSDPDRPLPLPPISCWLGEINYSGRGHSVLCMPPNKGISFDLEAIRRANPGARIARFTSIAGNTETRSENELADRVSADLWVFVDGELRFSKKDVNSTDGIFAVEVPLTPGNRFITLVATDAGNGSSFDWTIFGDPRLELKPESSVRDTH